MIQAVIGVVTSLIGLGGKLIEDKDKRTEFAFKTLETTQQFMSVMLSTKTYPFVDAIVKLSYASEQLVKGLFRPLASVASMGVVVYCRINLIELPQELEYVLMSLLPAWMVDRGLAKRRTSKTPMDYTDEY